MVRFCTNNRPVAESSSRQPLEYVESVRSVTSACRKTTGVVPVGPERPEARPVIVVSA
jgi:hypothetical protein